MLYFFKIHLRLLSLTYYYFNEISQHMSRKFKVFATWYISKYIIVQVSFININCPADILLVNKKTVFFN